MVSTTQRTTAQDTSQATDHDTNHLCIVATIAEIAQLRYSPAGVPILGCTLAHESVNKEDGVQRVVRLVLRAVCFGCVAERLAQQDLGTCWSFRGFLFSPRSGRVVYQIQDFLAFPQLSEQEGAHHGWTEAVTHEKSAPQTRCPEFAFPS
ncbi:primosomal replication protein N [Candidatus Symbiobacter mobilis]|uniref:Primosomal replication protein N n=1 Tax=Candidatus Symbiobacter mobilis CR TaxID=946483 RepID=U5N567_9BURK|nr:primosomal replication protein N [Candidatus Symbiobacter mobilis]AGX86395.1 primosomal replication protein N [Candidatus Symbiobacter mobilis CR]